MKRILLVCMLSINFLYAQECPVDIFQLHVDPNASYTITRHNNHLTYKSRIKSFSVTKQVTKSFSELEMVQQQNGIVQARWLLKPDIDYQVVKPRQLTADTVIKFYHKSCLPLKRVTVVLDAGHGGKDSGAINKQLGVYEKNITLNLTKMIARKISKNKHINVVLTRDRDVFLPLRERIDIARKNHADLFISIHADAFIDSKAKGASVFTLSPNGAQSSANKHLASQEKNMSMLTFDSIMNENRQLHGILFDMQMTDNIVKSLSIGNRLIKSMKKHTTLHSNKVDQAAFLVLTNPFVPSVLIESGFLTNRVDAARLTSQQYLDKLAGYISGSVVEHFTPDYHTYSVKSGDTLTKIAAHNKRSVDDLLRINHLKTSRLVVGQQLIIK